VRPKVNNQAQGVSLPVTFHAINKAIIIPLGSNSILSPK
jgi:hypothetical protein